MPGTSRGVALVRRGVRHGTFPEGVAASAPKDAGRLWREDRPILFRGILRGRLDASGRRAVHAARACFERVRAGGGWDDFVARRLEAASGFRRGTASVEMFDPREIEKTYVDAVRRGRVVARDLYAKLSWISTDRRDLSLRVRFSFGSELLGAWHRDPSRAVAADRFAEVVFPEGPALARHPRILALLGRLAGGPVRLSERIVYSNAPGGGAVFHHDAEPTQLGVLYGQFAGETAWLALPKRDLAEALVAYRPRGALGRRVATPAKAMKALDDAEDPALGRLLNETPRFTRELARRGALLRLRAGDVLVLPSHHRDACCWHAVFAPGRAASLAHSYGIFARGARGNR